MLESASGQVRCGACLTIFDAIEHFVNQQDASGNNTDEESVFLGNNPQDYFDPSMFLSRASLTEPDNYKEKDSKDDLIQVNDAIDSPSNTSNFSAHNSTDPEIQESWGRRMMPNNIEEVDQSTEAIRARALENELEDEEAFEIISEEHLEVLDQVVPPLELTTKRNSDWFRRITLTLVGIFLGGVLFAQYLIQNTHIYSQQTEFRQFYIIVCNFLQCDLPMFSNIAAIRSDNLTVRSHLEAENALTVNIAFRNTADFPQAFPILVLSFNTVNNDIVALREFAPTEYLDVGLRSMTMMPVMSPVQINLELVDPGPDAVNYTIAFRRP